jgi:LPXTG-motif cell wall-anchored protein
MDFDDPMTWILLIGIPVLVGIGVFVFLRARKPKQEAIHYFRCPSCKRKLRYYARQAGHRGMCNSCKEPLTFPTAVGTGR